MLSESLLAIAKEQGVVLGSKNFKVPKDESQEKNRFSVVPDSKVMYGLVDGTW